MTVVCVVYSGTVVRKKGWGPLRGVTNMEGHLGATDCDTIAVTFLHLHPILRECSIKCSF